MQKLSRNVAKELQKLKIYNVSWYDRRLASVFSIPAFLKAVRRLRLIEVFVI